MQKEGSKINFNEICKIIDESKSLSKLNDLCKINEKYFNLFQLFLSDNKNLINLEINPEQIDSIYENKLSEYPMEKIQYIKKYYEMEEFFLIVSMLRIDLITLLSCKNYNHYTLVI